MEKSVRSIPLRGRRVGTEKRQEEDRDPLAKDTLERNF